MLNDTFIIITYRLSCLLFTVFKTLGYIILELIIILKCDTNVYKLYVFSTNVSSTQ